jgi:hypothetical protein
MNPVRRDRSGRVLAALLMIAFFTSSVCAAIVAETRWADPRSVTLDIEFPGEGYHANWELFRCDCGDLMVRSRLDAPGEVDTGETVLVGGRAVLSRGFGEQQAELGASLDAPALMMQLALRLLERAAPGGPSAIDRETPVDVTDAVHHITLDTGGAVGGFQAPWSVSGVIAPAGPDQRRFDLHFEFSVPSEGETQQASMRLKGLADFGGGDFPVSDSESLDGWQLSWRDENDAAAKEAGSVGTLGQLRKLIQGN